MEHEYVKMEEDVPPPPYSIRHWASRWCSKSCKPSLKNVLLIIILYLVARNLLSENGAQLHQVVTSQIPVTPQNSANEASATPAKVETHAPVVTTQEPTKLPTPVVTTQEPTKPPTSVVTTQEPTKPPTSVVTTQAPTRLPTQAMTTQRPPTKAEWEWRSQSFTLSCKNTILAGTVLSADCQTKSGSTEHSQLDLNCAITNVDGVLQWAYTGTVARFKDSSRAHYIVVEDGGGDVTLHGKCQTMQGHYIDCSIVLNSGIKNIDGELTPSEGHECTHVPDVHVQRPPGKCRVPIPFTDRCLFWSLCDLYRMTSWSLRALLDMTSSWCTR